MRPCLRLAFACALAFGATARAEDSVGDVKSSIEQLQATIKAQQARLDQLEARMAADRQADLAQVARELAADAATQSSVPGWLDNLTFSGDFRLRYHNDYQFGSGLDRKPKTRNRARFRLRFGFIKTWLDDQLEVGFRLASGEADAADGEPLVGPVTTSNQTFTDVFSKKPVWIDRAYARYEPKVLPGLTVIGGKMATPMVHTDMIWDSDVNPEGFWGQYKLKRGPAQPFVNVGYFIVDENIPGRRVGDAADPRNLDVTLVSYQVGNTWAIADDVKWTVAATYYDFDQTENLGWIDRGGFQVINLTNQVEWELFKLPWSAYVDLAYNCNEDYPAGMDEADADSACAVGVKVGKNKKKGDWSLAYKFARIERFATPAALNDAEFNHTNVQGHSIRARYNLADFLTVGANVYILRHIIAPAEDAGEITTQVDLMWQF